MPTFPEFPSKIKLVRWVLTFSDGREMKTFVLIVALALLCPGFMLADVEMQRSSLKLSRERRLISASSCNNDRQQGGRDSSSMWSVLHDDVDTLRKPWTADEASQAVKTRRSAFYRNEYLSLTFYMHKKSCFITYVMTGRRQIQKAHVLFDVFSMFCSLKCFHRAKPAEYI